MTTADLPHIGPADKPSQAGRPGAVGRALRNFRRWRRRRPFYGGKLLILSGVEMFLSGNLQLTALKVHFGPEGFQSYMIPLVILVCGILTWITPAQRLFYGIIGTLVAVYSLIGVNLGGFFLGMLLGVVGGALTVAWTPVEPVEPVTAPPAPADPDGPPPSSDTAVEEPGSPLPPGWFGEPGGAGYAEEYRPPPDDPTDPGHRMRYPAIGVVLLIAVAAAVYSIVDTQPAFAEPCASAPAGAAAVAAAPPPASARKSPGRSSAPAPDTAKAAPPAAPAPPAASPSPSGGAAGAGGSGAGAGSGTGAQPQRGPIGQFFDWLGRLFTGGGGNEAPDPDPSAAPSSPSGGGSSAPGSPAPGGSAKPAPSGSAKTSASPSRSAAKSPSPSASACPAPRVAAAPGQPPVAQATSQMLADRLSQSGLSFDGVTELPVRGGVLRALKFTLRRSVATNFELRVPVGSRVKVLSTPELTVEGDVSFYATRFSGKLFGLLPVTFTPDFPPPLVLPEMFLTAVDIQLAFVHATRLLAPDLNVRYLPA